MKKVLDFFKTYWITIGIYVVLILGYKYIADTGMFGGFLFPKVDKIVSSTIQNIPTMISIDDSCDCDCFFRSYSCGNYFGNERKSPEGSISGNLLN